MYDQQKAVTSRWHLGGEEECGWKGGLEPDVKQLYAGFGDPEIIFSEQWGVLAGFGAGEAVNMKKLITKQNLLRVL